MDVLRHVYLGVPNFLETYGIVGFIVVGFLSVSVHYGIVIQVALLWLYAGLIYLAINYAPALIMISYFGIRLNQEDEEDNEEQRMARMKIREPYFIMLVFLFFYSYIHYNTADELEIFIFRVKVFLLKYTNYGVVAVYQLK